MTNGGGAQTHSSGRWGDYTMNTIDPSDGMSFWHTNEYYPTTSSASWFTRVGKFQFTAAPTLTPTPTATATVAATATPTATPTPAPRATPTARPRPTPPPRPSGRSAKLELSRRDLAKIRRLPQCCACPPM